MPPLSFADVLILIAAPLLLAGSAFFSGSETALFSLTRLQRTRLRKDGTIAGQTIGTLLDETRSLLITLLLGNMTVNVLYFVLSTVLMIRMSNEHAAGPITLGLVTAATLMLVILLGEVVPKLLASRFAVMWATFSALPLLIVHRALTPMRIVLNTVIITPLARLIAPRHKPTALSADELQMMLDLSVEHGVIDADEEQLLEQVLELSELSVQELMVHRVDIEAFDLDDSPDALLTMMRDTGLARIPVYRSDLDHLEGVIFSRQALLNPPQTREDVNRIIRQIKYVPEQQMANQTLIELRKSGTTFAIVVDEFGGTSGLVTLEDIVEHMVGHIPGPWERTERPLAERLDENTWRIDPELPIRDWADVLPALSPQQRTAVEDILTIGGLVMARIGRVPHTGDRTQMGNLELEVEKMEGVRMVSLLVRLVQEDGTRS